MLSVGCVSLCLGKHEKVSFQVFPSVAVVVVGFIIFSWFYHFSWAGRRSSFCSPWLGLLDHGMAELGQLVLLPDRTQVVLGAAWMFVRREWSLQCGGSWCSEGRRCWRLRAAEECGVQWFVLWGCRQGCVVLQAEQNRLACQPLKTWCFGHSIHLPGFSPGSHPAAGNCPSAEIIALELGLGGCICLFNVTVTSARSVQIACEHGLG